MTGSHPLGSIVQLAGRCRPAVTQPYRPGHLLAPVQQAPATSHKLAAGPSALDALGWLNIVEDIVED